VFDEAQTLAENTQRVVLHTLEQLRVFVSMRY
jgi:hypothetical protein